MYTWTVRKSSTEWKWWSMMIMMIKLSVILKLPNQQDSQVTMKNIWQIKNIYILWPGLIHCFRNTNHSRFENGRVFLLCQPLPLAQQSPPAPLFPQNMLQCLYCLGFLMTTIIIITKGENKRPFCPEFLCSMVVCQAVMFLSVQGSK